MAIFYRCDRCHREVGKDTNLFRIKVPLETERGYNAMLFDPEIMP